MPERDIRVEESEMLKDTIWMMRTLTKGSLILIPYDCAPNSDLCFAGGHKVLTLEPLNIEYFFRTVENYLSIHV